MVCSQNHIAAVSSGTYKTGSRDKAINPSSIPTPVTNLPLSGINQNYLIQSH